MSVYWYNNGMRQHMSTNVWPEKPLRVKTKPGRFQESDVPPSMGL